MPILVTGLFSLSQQAGEAVAELKTKGYTDSISIVAKDIDGSVSTSQVKESKTEEMVAGAAVGGSLGGLAGLIGGAVATSVPGGILLVAGPLAAAWGITGAAVGTLSGGLVGALADAGFSEEDAQQFADEVLRGEVMVFVTGDENRIDSILDIMNSHDVIETLIVPSS